MREVGRMKHIKWLLHSFCCLHVFLWIKGDKNPDFGKNKDTTGYQEPAGITEQFLDWRKCRNKGKSILGIPKNLIWTHGDSNSFVYQ